MDVRRYSGVVLSALLGVAVTTGGAQAASVSSLLFLNEPNRMSDNSAEEQGVDLNGDSLLWVGDTLRGTAQWNTIEGTGGSGVNSLGVSPGDLNNELTSIFEVEVVSATIASDLDGSCGGDLTCGGGTALSGDEFVNYTFGPNAAFVAAFGLTPGTMVAFYEDPTPDWDRTDPILTAEANATNEALVWELGFYGDADEGWASINTPVDPSFLTTIADATPVGVFQFQLSIGFNALFSDFVQVAAGCVFVTCAGDRLIDVNGGGNVLGTAGSGQVYEGGNDVNLVFHPIPEPGTLGMLGLGLAGLGLFLRRRQRAA